MEFIAILSIVISVAILAYSYTAASKLKESGSLLRGGDAEAAGDTLSEAGEMYRNMIKAGAVCMLLAILIGFYVSSSLTTAYDSEIEQETEESKPTARPNRPK